MNFSSVMEEAEGRHYEVRFSSTQRWAVAAIVLLALAIAYLACEVVITVPSVVEPRLTGVAWGGQVVPLEALWPVRCVVLTALVEAFLVVNPMIRTHVTIDRGERDHALSLVRGYRRGGVVALLLGAALAGAAFALGGADPWLGGMLVPSAAIVSLSGVVALGAAAVGRHHAD